MTTKAKVLGWVPAVVPGLIALLVYLAWGVAYLQLGRRPLPSMDDPKYIGGISTMVSSTVSTIVSALLLCWLLSSVLTVLAGVLPKTERRIWWWIQFIIGLVGMAILLGSIRYSPGAAVTWFID